MFHWHLYRLANRPPTADSPLSLAIVYWLKPVADAHAQFHESFALVHCSPVPMRMWTPSVAEYCLIDLMSLRSSCRLRDFPPTMWHKWTMPDSKSYSLASAHLWPNCSVDLAAKIEIVINHLAATYVFYYSMVQIRYFLQLNDAFCTKRSIPFWFVDSFFLPTSQ